MFLSRLTSTTVGLTAWDMFVIDKPTVLMVCANMKKKQRTKWPGHASLSLIVTKITVLHTYTMQYQSVCFRAQFYAQEIYVSMYLELNISLSLHEVTLAI